MIWLEKANEKINGFLAVVAGVCMVALMCVMVLNMVMRYFYDPLLGTYDYVTWFGIFTISYALGFTQLHKDHIRIDFVVKFFPDRVEKAILAVMAWASAIFFGFLSWWLFVAAQGLMASSSGSRTLGWPEYPFAFAVVLGCLAMTLALLVDALNRSRVAIWGTEEEPTGDIWSGEGEKPSDEE